jgi:hypothetical protein
MIDHDARTTVYFSPAVRKALKKRIVDTEQTMSEYVDRAVALAIAEDLQDIETIEQRRSEPTETLDAFLAALKRDGLI